MSAEDEDALREPTPGRWFVRASRTDGVQVMAETDRLHLGEKNMGQKWPELLATVYMRPSRGERHANARAMAAAPELLAAARLALTPGADPEAVRLALEAAVAKAAVYRAVKEPEVKKTKADVAADAMQDNWVSGD